LPVYANVQFDTANPRPALDEILGNPYALSHYPYPLTGQSFFFPIPSMVTGALLQVRANRTTYSGLGQMALIEYNFNADFIDRLTISSNFGLNSPIPCFQITRGNGVDTFLDPLLGVAEWKVILAEVEKVVADYAAQQGISITAAKSRIPIESLPTNLSSLINKYVNGAIPANSPVKILAWFYPTPVSSV
jgi:hypothetical protein